MPETTFKRMYFIIAFIAVLLTVVILIGLAEVNGQSAKPIEKNPDRQFRMINNPAPASTAALAKSIEKLCPPLTPQRFRRRMKMLWGVDINDYPADKLIIIGGDHETGDLLFSPSNRLIWMKTYQTSPVYGNDVPKSFPPNKYALFYRYAMMNDAEALDKYYKDYQNTLQVDYNYTADFLVSLYGDAPFESRNETIKYIDTKTVWPLIYFPYQNYKQFFSDLRLDAIYLYIKGEEKKGRSLQFGEIGAAKENDSILLEPDYLRRVDDFGYGGYHLSVLGGGVNPWYPMVVGETAGACWFASQLRYDIKEIKTAVTRDLYRKFGSVNSAFENLLAGFRNSAGSNNYYGYTLLREFMTNPMREMPSLAKIGTSITGTVNSDVKLLLEPFPNSLDFDVISPGEVFKAYEMGHDDYYFVEVVKPVESPVAGPDGYAMILDRTETVRGYLLKKDVKAVTDADLLAHPVYNDISKSRQGAINDPDGYVNVRSGRSTKSEIAGRVTDGELFRYWEILGSSWFIVQTGNNLRGFMSKDRIKEKVQ